jgi:hypothetical protein
VACVVKCRERSRPFASGFIKRSLSCIPLPHQISFSFIFLVHIVACGYWLMVSASCTFCDDDSISGEYGYRNDCKETVHYGSPSFTTQDFCPSVYKTSSTDVHNTGYKATLTDKYLFAFYWAM